MKEMIPSLFFNTRRFDLQPVFQINIPIQIEHGKTVWLPALLGLGLILLIYLFYRLAISMNRNRELEKKLAEQTRELARQKENFEPALDRLKQIQLPILESVKMAALGKLMGGVVHDINNPVTFILGNIPFVREYSRVLNELIANYETLLKNQEWVREDVQRIENFNKEKNVPFLLTELEKVLNSVEEGAQRIAGIVKNLRLFSGSDSRISRAVDLNNCIRTVVNTIPKGMTKKTTIHLALGSIPEIEGNEGEMNLVILNLVLQSLQSLSGKEGNVWIETWEEDRQVKCRVKDDGEEIPPESRSAIFDPFLPSSGSGIDPGVSISSWIISKYQGRIIYEGKGFENRGNSIVVELPQVNG